MKGKSLEAAERRWRNKTLFHRSRSSGWHVLAWLLFVVATVLLSLLVVSGDAPLFDSFL
jgi:cobalamin biosynthesis protein CobD/CbiB